MTDSTVDWASLVPAEVLVPLEQREAFLRDAPEGTLIEADDEVYRRVPSGRWRHLDELVYEGSFYASDYRVHGSSTPEELFMLLKYDHLRVRVLRWGDGR